MQKIKCLMKKNGLFFLGIPVGMDKIMFNANRVYGRLRIPMMIEGLLLTHYCIYTYMLIKTHCDCCGPTVVRKEVGALVGKNRNPKPVRYCSSKSGHII